MKKGGSIGSIRRETSPSLQRLGTATGRKARPIVAANLLKKLGEGESEKPWKRVREEEVRGLRAADTSLGNKRGNKTFFLPVPRQRVIYALACLLWDERGAEDIKEAIRSPYNNKGVVREVSVAWLSKLIYGNAKEQYRRIVFKELVNAAATPQLFVIRRDGREYWRISPIIQLEGEIKDGIPLVEEVRVSFSFVFFEELTKHYASLSPLLFEVWRDNGTALFATLLDILLGDYWGHYGAAQRARQKVRREAMENSKMGITITEEELRLKQDEAARKAMTFEMKASTIKERIGRTARDYETSTAARRRFWQDLNAAVGDLKKLFILEEAARVEDTEKIKFTLSEENGRNSPNRARLLE